MAVEGGPTNMPGIRWNADGGGDNAYDSGTVTLFDQPKAPTQPSASTYDTPVSTEPVGQRTLYPSSSSGSSLTANDWRPPTTPAGQQWDANVASFVPTNIPIDPSGYILSGGQLVDKSNPSARTAGTDWFAPFAQTLSEVQSSDDPNYWRTQIANDPKVLAGDQSAIAYWQDRIRRGDGSMLVKNGQLQKFQDGGGGTQYPGVNAFGYDDPSSMLFLSAVLNRLQQLQQPRTDPVQGQLADLIQQLVAKNQQAPYTAGNDAALVAHYREPLTQARDAALRQNTEQASRRGYLPSSGLLRRTNSDTQNAYIKAVGSASNDLGVRAVDESQNRQLQAIQALAGLVQSNQTVQDRQDSVANDILKLSEIFPNFDQNRLSMLLNASGDTSANSAITGLTNLGQTGLGASKLNLANDAGSASAWGQILGYIIEHMK